MRTSELVMERRNPTRRGAPPRGRVDSSVLLSRRPPTGVRSGWVPCPGCVDEGQEPCKWFAVDWVSTPVGTWAAILGWTVNDPRQAPGVALGTDAIEVHRP